MSDSTWTTVIDDERGIFRIEVNRGVGRVFLHLTVKKWNSDVLRSMKDGIAVLKGTLKAVGIKKISVVIPEGDEKLKRFEEFFGFKEVNRKGGQLLMEQEN